MESNPEYKLANKKEIPEYSFDQGLDKIIENILQLLEKDVGKTKLSIDIMERLYKQNIASITLHDLSDLKESNLKALEAFPNTNKIVFLLDQFYQSGTVSTDENEKVKKYYNERVIDIFKKKGFTINGIDLWIGIYRPERPLKAPEEEGGVIADMIIRNDQAREK